MDDRHGGAKSCRSGLLGDVCRASAGITACRVSDHAGRIAAPSGAGRKAAGNAAGVNIAAAILLSVEHSDTVRHWLKNASIPVMEMGAMRADPIDMNIGIDNVAAMLS
jgi:hypothetical protein